MPFEKKRSNAYIVYIVFTLAIITLIATLLYVDINEDEALLAEHSFRLLTEGNVRSEFFFSMGSGLEFIQLQYHKLFIILGSLFSSIFGNSLYSFRAVTILFSVLFVFVYSKYILQSENRLFLYLTLGLLFLQATFITFTMIFRPEIVVMFFGFCSWLFIEKSINEDSKLTYLGGVFAGLALLTHLNGIIFVIAGFSLLIYRRKYKAIIIFSLASIAVSLLYFWDITNLELLKLWFTQFRNDPTMVEKKSSFALSLVTNLLSEHKRFLHSGEEISLTLLLVSSIVLSWKFLLKEKKNLLVYLLILVVSLGIIAHGKTVKYQILYFPFIFIIISYAFFVVSKKRRAIITTFIALFVLVNMYSSFRNLNYNYSPIELNHRVAGMMENGSNVMVRERFFFNDGTDFNLRSLLAFTWKYERYLKQDYTIEQFFEFNTESENKYIFVDVHSFDSKILKMIDELQLSEGEERFGYKLIKKDKDFYLFKIINHSS